MSTEYRVMFAGVVLDGFDVETVKKTAAMRLKASNEQITRLFSGRTAILKKGLSHELGERYITELRRIGMLVKLEAISTVVAPPVPTVVLPATPQTTVSDLEKTQLATPDALARYLSDKPVETRQAHDPERTLIANAGALEAYFAANSVASPMGNMTSTNIKLPSHNKLEDAPPLQLAENGLMATYLAENAEANPASHLRENDISSTPVLPISPSLSPIQSEPAIRSLSDGTKSQASMPFSAPADRMVESDFAGYRNTDEESDPAVTGFFQTSPKMQLVLITLGGACLLALIAWLVR